MLLATVNPEAAQAIGNIKKVGVGNVVVYHARAGYMRDKRTEFPAFVLRQYEDGSVDLLVFMEREDFATEERVCFRSHNQPHHCWTVVDDVPGRSSNDLEEEPWGDEPPAPRDPAIEEMQNLHEHIATLTARIAALEAKRGPGRPPKQPKAE